jgi:hypothetical protein
MSRISDIGKPCASDSSNSRVSDTGKSLRQ